MIAFTLKFSIDTDYVKLTKKEKEELANCLGYVIQGYIEHKYPNYRFDLDKNND